MQSLLATDFTQEVSRKERSLDTISKPTFDLTL